MVLQNIVINQLLVPIYEDWLDQALMRGMIRMPNGSALPAAKRDKFADHIWQARRWQWVDPMKDINAAILAIGNGLAQPATDRNANRPRHRGCARRPRRLHGAGQIKGINLPYFGQMQGEPDTHRRADMSLPDMSAMKDKG